MDAVLPGRGFEVVPCAGWDGESTMTSASGCERVHRVPRSSPSLAQRSRSDPHGVSPSLLPTGTAPCDGGRRSREPWEFVACGVADGFERRDEGITFLW